MFKPMAQMTSLEREEVRKNAGVVCYIDGCTRGVYLLKEGLCNAHLSKIKHFGSPHARNQFESNEIRVVGKVAYISLYSKKLEKVAEAIIDSSDVCLVQNYKWCRTIYGYVQTTRKNRGKTLRLHRLILKTEAETIDHINGNPLDNRKCNLRPATTFQNGRNKGSRSASGYKGVYPSRSRIKPWNVRVWYNGKNIEFGGWDDKLLAAHTYNTIIEQILGEDFSFARPNRLR